jgi:hypothetical protein
MRSFFFVLMAGWFAAWPSAIGQQTNILVEAGLVHIGQRLVASFPEGAKSPRGPRLERSFEAQSNPSEWTLRLKQRGIVDDWAVELNGRAIARLNIGGGERVAHFAIPPGTLVEGTNTFAIVPRGNTNDILVSQIEILPQRMRDLLKLAHVSLNVTDAGGSGAVPARVTVVDAENKLADLYNVKPDTAAWRKGIVYTGGLPLEYDLPAGNYVVTATRGAEWSRRQIKLQLFLGQQAQLSLPISHEVDTPGFIAADTHLHTYTFSNHGDASLDERIYTLAGEGVEMAIATDHNHFTDYKPRQAVLGASQYYTSVIGNEVTSGNGHFNAFPFALDAQKPNHKETNWVKLVADIRSKGAEFVILNHPRWPAITNSPFSIWGLNRADGTRTNAVEFTMDAIELANSSFPVPPKDPTFLLRDWFALLNRGEKLWAVGASDSHTISEAPGQGRTYVASSAEDAASIDVDAAIKAMRAGDMSVSYGIFGHATVNGARMGQMTKPANGVLNVKFHVACPTWIAAKRAVVYLNGVQIAEQEITMAVDRRFATNMVFEIPAPRRDAHLVCVAFGEGVKDPSWKTMADFTLAVTNPIFVDADQDGKFSSPRETALALLNKATPTNVRTIGKMLENVDPAIGMQLLTEAKLRIAAAEIGAFEELVSSLAKTNTVYEFYRSQK